MLTNKRSHSQKYATYGALLSLGSPLGWALIDTSFELNMGHPYLFYYLIAGTCTSFTIFAYFLGKKIDDIEAMSQRDPMTGLYNQSAYFELSEKIFSQCVRSNLSGTACLIDIDHFKQVNDRNDHLFGNYVIKKIATLIKDEVRTSDIASRFGGDEFALFLPDTSAEKATMLIDRIRNSIGSQEIKKGNHSAKITLSVGLCDIDTENRDLKSLLKKADEALYKSKHDGRNRSTIYKEEAH